MKILTPLSFLFTAYSHLEALVNFMSTLDYPTHFMTLLEEILQKVKVKEQAWCQKILIDLVTAVSAYLASEVILQEKPDPKW